MLNTCKLATSLWYQSRFSFTRVRRAKTHKLTQYPVIPPWLETFNKDPFDYKLRSRDDIIAEQEVSPPDFPIRVIVQDYPADANYETADRSRKMQIELNMRDMNLTKLQRKRLIFLLGPRYKDSDIFKLTADMYATQEENLAKVLEIARELFWEAKRAP